MLGKSTRYPYFYICFRWVVILVVIVGCGWLSLYVIAEYNDQTKSVSEQLQQVVELASLPYKLSQLADQEQVTELPVPVYGVSLTQIADTWGAARSEDRTHEGVDIFAERGTPVFSSTQGYVTRVGFGERGGNFVFVSGPGNVRYYYAHLDRIADGMRVGTPVTTDTVLGFVGTTGNAETTPPHLHMGMYQRPGGAMNPYPLLVDRQ